MSSPRVLSTLLLGCPQPLVEAAPLTPQGKLIPFHHIIVMPPCGLREQAAVYYAFTCAPCPNSLIAHSLSYIKLRGMVIFHQCT